MKSISASAALLIWLSIAACSAPRTAAEWTSVQRELALRVAEDQQVRRDLQAAGMTDMRLIERVSALDAANTAWLKEIVHRDGWPTIEHVGEQGAKGAWAHEYPNPFVTALALQALAEAKARGARIDPAKFDAGARALLSTRDDEGNYSYGFPGKGDSDVFSAGRNPQAELALKLAKLSDDAKVAAAITKSFAHHDAYEAVRKYDDHAPPHRIGGFFFFYDQMHRVDAILSLADPMKRAELLKKQREILLRIPEIDGRFVDSHELGKAYGAAAGLICLKATTPVER